VTAATATTVYICPQCGAGHSVREGDVTVRCRYCSTVFRTFAEEQRYLLPVYYDSSAALENFLLWVKKQVGVEESLPFNIELAKVELHFYPFWVVSLDVRTSFTGLGEDAEYAGKVDGAYREVRTVYKRESGTLERSFEYAIPASPEIPEAKKGYRISSRGRSYFSSEYVKRTGGVLHGATIDRARAIELAKELAKNEMTWQIMREVVQVDRRSDEVNVGEAVFVSVPVWRVTYRFKGKEYHAMIDASSSRVIQATYPPDVLEKAGYMGIGVAHMVAAFAFAALLFGLGALPAATAFIGFAAAAAGYLSRAIGPTRAGEEVE
jgi:hypothetical protein